MRLALVLAAPFPTLQGSQRHVAEQARALQGAGAEVTLFTYGTGTDTTRAGRSVADLEVIRVPAGLSPRSLRSGFQPAKLVADFALGIRLLREHRRRNFDAILAHNVEAAATALSVRRWLRRPVVYMAHTLWEEELASYLPQAAAGTARALGARIDRGLASWADAVVVLSREAEARLAPFAHGDITRIVPGYTPEPPPDPKQIENACNRFGLEAEGFVLYPGNLDRYQNLALLDAAAEHFDLGPVLAGAHDTRGVAFPNLRALSIDDPETLRQLVFAARIVVIPRRAVGGFPIKALQAMEAARPIVALEGVVDTLTHDESAWLLPQGADGRDLAAALHGLWNDAEHRARLGKNARATLAHPSNRGDVLSAVSVVSQRNNGNSGKNVPTPDR
ncbi:MAG: glycosyltransferase family 4 protein [Deltaproteobacteria bacterium]|nr:glycosyltransferase family 4 protein [Deltaproteobacteria bacterium]MBW2395784.1 glycosyltransferase family 4 protein [Deltaproteobacteria bacterium]